MLQGVLARSGVPAMAMHQREWLKVLARPSSSFSACAIVPNCSEAGEAHLSKRASPLLSPGVDDRPARLKPQYSALGDCFAADTRSAE